MSRHTGRVAEALIVVETGWATTVQDAGRPGLAHLGVAPAGYVDPPLARSMNRLVGNPPDAAVFETAGGLVVESLHPVVVAASVATAPAVLRPGRRMIVRPDGTRQWHYLAVRGGLDVVDVLGSRSQDTMSGIGPGPVTVGARYGIGPEPSGAVADVAPVAADRGPVRIWPGPRSGWFDGDVVARLTSGPVTVVETSRVGIRLHGPTMNRIRRDELPSEGLVRGAIQVTPNGDVIVMVADHPTTGGYPVVAVVDPDHVAQVAQHPPGTSVMLSTR